MKDISLAVLSHLFLITIGGRYYYFYHNYYNYPYMHFTENKIETERDQAMDLLKKMNVYFLVDNSVWSRLISNSPQSIQE